METNEQQAIEEHNRVQLWVDVANHLRIAAQSVEQAQLGLEDLKLDDFADALDEIKDQLRRAANDASEEAGL